MKKTKKTNSSITFLKEICGAINLSQVYAATGRVTYALFGKKYFVNLETAMTSIGYSIVPHIYVGQAVLASIIIFFLTIFYIYLNATILHMISITVIMAVMIPVFVLIGTFFVLYYAPIERMKNKERSINVNLPFALTHLAAISSAGSPPTESFRIFSHFDEFGAVQDEAKHIVKRIDVFGEDLTTALKNVQNTTPSMKFKKVLGGMLTIINTGGNLNAYLNSMAEEFMFDYKITREKYLDTLGTYADIYTAILIAAPLFLVATLAVLNIIPNTSGLPGGFSISTILFLGVYILIPILNILFIAFVTFTSPEV